MEVRCCVWQQPRSAADASRGFCGHAPQVRAGSICLTAFLFWGGLVYYRGVVPFAPRIRFGFDVRHGRGCFRDSSFYAHLPGELSREATGQIVLAHGHDPYRVCGALQSIGWNARYARFGLFSDIARRLLFVARLCGLVPLPHSFWLDSR